MAQKGHKKQDQFVSTIKEALEEFDLAKFKLWVKTYNKPLWASFKKQSKEVQMATMCKHICDRTDMLGSEAHKKAVSWLREHNMKGRMF